MISNDILNYAVINFFLGIVIFYIGRSLHELGHYIIAKKYKLSNLKIYFNIFNNPFKGAHVHIEDHEYLSLEKNKRFFLLFSGFLSQWIFYGIVWIFFYYYIKKEEFYFLFSLVMFVLIIPDILLNSFSEKGDINRLFRLK